MKESQNENKVIKVYPDAWYAIEYEVDEAVTHFRAWKIDSFNPDDLYNLDDIGVDWIVPEIRGLIKFDGCMEFKQEEHYCGLHHAEQTLMLMQYIYEFNGSLDEVNESD